MTYLEMTNVLSKQWASVSDIKKIGRCGRDKATLIRNIINDDIISNGLNLPIAKEKLVPMEYVIKYFNLDIDYIYSMAEKEKKLCKVV